MFDKENPNITYTDGGMLIVGEIVHRLRAQGNTSSTGTVIDASSSSPVISGIYSVIPGVQIGIMSFETFIEHANDFSEMSNPSNTGEHPWNLVGAASLDTLFVPYSTQTDSGRVGPYLPHFEMPESGYTLDVNSLTLNPFNPFNILKQTGKPVSLVYDLASGWMASGHNIQFALCGNPHDSGIDGLGGYVGAVSGLYPSGSGSPIDYSFEKDHFVRHNIEIDSIRSVGLRSPLVLSGWGYDTNGGPVPTGVSGVIHPRAMYDTSLWKTGPVDLRWDENRKVWTGGGGGTKIVRFRIEGDLACDVANCSSATAKIFSRPAGEGKMPEETSSGTITVWDVSHSDTSFYTGGVRGFLNEPADQLLGRMGWAAYMDGKEITSDVLNDVDECAFGPDQINGRWEIISLPCTEGSCD